MICSYKVDLRDTIAKNRRSSVTINNVYYTYNCDTKHGLVIEFYGKLGLVGIVQSTKSQRIEGYYPIQNNFGNKEK